MSARGLVCQHVAAQAAVGCRSLPQPATACHSLATRCRNPSLGCVKTLPIRVRSPFSTRCFAIFRFLADFLRYLLRQRQHFPESAAISTKKASPLPRPPTPLSPRMGPSSHSCRGPYYTLHAPPSRTDPPLHPSLLFCGSPLFCGLYCHCHRWCVPCLVRR